MPNTLTLSDVNAILIEILALSKINQDQLINQTTTIIHIHSDIHFLKFFLLDADKKEAVFRGGTAGQVSENLLTRGYRLQVDAIAPVDKISLLNENILTYTLPTKSQDCLDIKLESNQGPNYFSPLLAETRSTLSLPLRFQEKLIGLLRVFSTKKNAFELDDIIHFQLLADQITARLYFLDA